MHLVWRAQRSNWEKRSNSASQMCSFCTTSVMAAEGSEFQICELHKREIYWPMNSSTSSRLVSSAENRRDTQFSTLKPLNFASNPPLASSSTSLALDLRPACCAGVRKKIELPVGMAGRGESLSSVWASAPWLTCRMKQDFRSPRVSPTEIAKSRIEVKGESMAI